MKLKNLKPVLKNLDKNKYADIEKETEVAFKRMHMIQKQIHDNPSSHELYMQERRSKGNMGS